MVACCTANKRSTHTHTQMAVILFLYYFLFVLFEIKRALTRDFWYVSKMCDAFVLTFCCCSCSCYCFLFRGHFFNVMFSFSRYSWHIIIWDLVYWQILLLSQTIKMWFTKRETQGKKMSKIKHRKLLNEKTMRLHIIFIISIKHVFSNNREKNISPLELE